jgi:hypothetical protein
MVSRGAASRSRGQVAALRRSFGTSAPGPG